MFSSGTDIWIWPLQRMEFSFGPLSSIHCFCYFHFIILHISEPCDWSMKVNTKMLSCDWLQNFQLGLSLAKVYGTWFQRKIMQLQVKLSLKTELALISINTL